MKGIHKMNLKKAISNMFSKKETPVFEAKDYFSNLKQSIETMTDDKLKENLNNIQTHIINAHEMGQKTLVNKAIGSFESIVKEQAILAAGFDKFVYRDSVTKFIENVKPKNSVKIIELSRYPRVIPEENAKVIKKANDLNIFDDIVIVFTDLTNEDYKTDAERAVVERNKDPIAFGVIKSENKKSLYERMYFITDWEDEFCDLTFEKMIAKMKSLNIPNEVGTISDSADYVSRIIKESKEEDELKKSNINISSNNFVFALDETI